MILAKTKPPWKHDATTDSMHRILLLLCGWDSTLTFVPMEPIVAYGFSVLNFRARSQQSALGLPPVKSTCTWNENANEAEVDIFHDPRPVV